MHAPAGAVLFIYFQNCHIAQTGHGSSLRAAIGCGHAPPSLLTGINQQAVAGELWPQ